MEGILPLNAMEIGNNLQPDRSLNTDFTFFYNYFNLLFVVVLVIYFVLI